jgi:hypothetical protein
MTRALWTHLVKDLRIEWRSLDAIVSMLFFSLLVVVLFSIAFDPRGDFSREIAGGVLCVATMFASVSALNQAWAREIRHQVIDAQRMAPAPGAELYLAKVIANFLFVTIVQVILAPFFLIFYNLHIEGQAGCWRWFCRWAPGRWSPTASSSPRSPSAAATANCCSRSFSFPSSFRRCWPWCRPPPPSSPATATPTLWIKLLARLRHHLHHRQPAALRRSLPRRAGGAPNIRPRSSAARKARAWTHPCSPLSSGTWARGLHGAFSSSPSGTLWSASSRESTLRKPRTPSTPPTNHPTAPAGGNVWTKKRFSIISSS